MERTHIADRNGPRVSNFLSHRIMESSKLMILGGCPGSRICFCLVSFFEKIIGFIWRSKDHLEDEGPIWTHLEDQLRIIWWWRDFPRMSKITDFNETHYSVRQKVGSTGSISMQNVFPLHPVTSKRPESPYPAKYLFLAEVFGFSVFRPIGPL